MSPDLRDEIRQNKPFNSLQQEASLNLYRTANIISDSFEQMLKPYGITGTQYNVLRILRGAEPAGLCRNEVRERLLSRMPDATRLLDRMEEAGLVVRSRDGEDRRQVSTRLTRQGKRLVDELDDVVAKEHQRRFGHLSEQQLRSLVKLLTVVRHPD